RIELAWRGFEEFWVGKGADGMQLPLWDAKNPKAGQLNPSILWSILNLWEDTQKSIRPVLANQVDWAKWEARMESLRKVLTDQLATEQGPTALAVSVH